MSDARASLPVLLPPIAPVLPPVHETRLDNGMRLLIVERTGLPVVDVRLVIRAGATHDPPELAGRTYLTADLLDEGTTTRTAPQIADEAEHLGASLHSHASWDYTSLDLHVLAPRFEPALELLADVSLRPAFPTAEVQRKRAERLAAILHEHDEPRTLANIAFMRALYHQQHPYSAPLGGTHDSISQLQTEQLRAFYHDHFHPDNAFLLLVGDVTTAHATDRISEYFGGWQTGLTAVIPALPQTAPKTTTISIVHRPGAPQSELRVGCPGPPRDTADYFPLVVSNTVLGGAFTSRINMCLREEKAYTYGAASRFAFRRMGGPFLVSTAVFTGATADAVNDIVREVARLRTEPISATELERAQNYLVLGLPRTFETTGDIAEHIVDEQVYGLGRDYFDLYGARVRAVTAEQVQQACAKWINADQLTITVVGDAAVVEPELRALALGTVEVIDGQ